MKRVLAFALLSFFGILVYGQEKDRKHAIDVDAIRQTELTGDIGLPPTMMNEAARPAHLQSFLSKYPDRSYFLFPESRENPIRMLDALPEVWLQRPAGSMQLFTGTPQPGEYFVFQVGVFAARSDLRDIK